MNIIYYAAARAARGQAEDLLDPALHGLTTVRDLLDYLGAEHTGQANGLDFTQVLRRCSVLLDGRRAPEHAPLAGVDQVDILPPFAGG